MKKILILTICLIIYATLYPQRHGTGILLDDSIFVNCPRAPALLSRDLVNLPSSVSLRNFAPSPGDQGNFSTCAGWALAYSVRTMVAAIQYGWSKHEIDKNVLSPSYIYNQIRPKPGCNSGTSIIQGLELLKNEGVLKITDFAYNCNLEVKNEDRPLASKYKIKEYRTIAYNDFKNKTVFVKKSLFEKNPVAICINCPGSFYTAGDVWKPDSIEYLTNYGGHALAVIGYDDEKYGGAFEVINSWGKYWGNKGFTWIRYQDFNHFCVWAGEEIPPSKQEDEKTGLSGSISFSLNSGKPVKLIMNENYFQTDQPMLSGTRFNLIVSNSEPAYVYAIGSDLTFKCNIIFPYNNKINPYLPYKQNNIAIPGEGYNFQLDSTSGKTYFFFLYSPVKLDIDSISKNIENSSGTFYDRIQKVLGEKLINKKDIEITVNNTGEIYFNSKSQSDNIVGLLVEITHINN